MKNNIILFALILIVAACSAPDNKAQLEKLRKQKAEIETKIEALEIEIAKTDTTNKDKISEIVAVKLMPEIFKSYIEVQGRVDADENVSLSTEMPGTITKINVKVGDEVSKGQVLAETDTRTIQQQMSDLQTNLDLSNQMFTKQENLWKQKIGTEMQFLQAKSNKESLEKKMGLLQEQIRMGKIISPINGTVDAINIKLAQSVAPGMPAINVVNFSNLKVKADLAESYSSRVKKGNDVQIFFPDLNDSTLSKVNYAARAINNLTRTFMVEVLLDNSKEYHPNMVTKLKINDYQSAKPEIILPVKYIQKGVNESFVLLAENGVAVKKSVKLGRSYSGITEIKEGLKEGDMLITDGYDLLNEGDKVSLSK